jgi:hypothetical protein
MIRTSSTKKILKILWILDILTPKIFPSDYVFLSSRLCPSITKMNNKGDKGHSFLNPCPLWKKGDAPSFIKVAKEFVLTQIIIQFVSMRPKPVQRRIIWRKYQLTQSYSFWRSNFRIRALNFFALMLWRHSYVVPTASRIYLPFKNYNFSPDKDRDMINFIMLAKIFAIIL